MGRRDFRQPRLALAERQRQSFRVMVIDGTTLILLAALELVQVFLFWLFIRRRYDFSLRQLSRMTGQMAAGERPKSYFIDGPPLVEMVSRHLETVGLWLEDLQRHQQAEDFNLNVLLANLVEGVMVVDQRHIVRLVNDELLNLFDLKQSPIGRSVLESLREAGVEMIVRETIQRGEPRRQEVILESTALGQPVRHFEISAVPIRTKKDAVGGAVLVFHDISRIKQLEVIRQEFVANVSHELRTPLAIFCGYLETLTDNPALSEEETRRIVEAMQRHSERLNALVEDLLTLTRLEAGRVETQFSTIRVDAFFRQLAQDWGMRGEALHAEIEIDVPGEVMSLEVDTLRFEQVMLNLIENAVTYSNPPRRISLSARADANEVEVRVADNGIGIPPGDLPHIFERFYRVDKGRSRASGGTGLGLSIVKHIIQAHGGNVYAESELGKGTTIVIRLPLYQKPMRASQNLAGVVENMRK
jgi:two-component system phosphate regulon sensor histidine kinase PhoR